VGWKQFYKITSSDFSGLYNAGQRWGQLFTYQWTVDTQKIYGAGFYYNKEYLGESPKIKITYQAFGAKQARVTVKFLIVADPNSSGEVDVGLFLKKNDEWSASSMPLISVQLSNSSTNYVVSTSMLRWEINEKSVAIYDEKGNKLTDFTLTDYAQSFTVFVRTAPSSGWIGLIVYEVTGEYYDQMEDMMNQIMTMMNIMMWVMLAVVIISAVVGMFRGRKRGETE